MTKSSYPTSGYHNSPFHIFLNFSELSCLQNERTNITAQNLRTFSLRFLSDGCTARKILSTHAIPKRISEATNNRAPGSYLNNKGDIGRVWRAASFHSYHW